MPFCSCGVSVGSSLGCVLAGDFNGQNQRYPNTTGTCKDLGGSSETQANTNIYAIPAQGFAPAVRFLMTYLVGAYSIQVSHGPKDRAEPHNGLLLSARLSTLDASPGVLRHFCKVPRGEHGNDTVAHARSYCVVVQVDNFCEILPHSSGHLQPACSA